MPIRETVAKVLVVGPPVNQIGGMATVVHQMLSLDFEGEFNLACFSTTLQTAGRRNSLDSVIRHAMQCTKLARAVAKENVRLVHLHTCSGFSFYRSILDLLVAKRCGCRTILHVHGAAFDEFHAHGGGVRRRWIRWGLEQADCVVALSKHWLQVLQSMAPRANVFALPNAVAVPDRKPLEPHDGPLRLLFLARMDDWKGVADLLSACEVLRNNRMAFELVLAGPPGTAGNEATLPQQIQSRNLGAEVRYVGPVDGAAKEALFEWAEVLVLPSWHEGMPLSLLEAMAHGLTVVATSVGAIPEVVHSGINGILVPPHRPDELARAMADLNSRPDLRKLLGAAAKSTVERQFSLDRFKSGLAGIYRQLLNTRESRNHDPPNLAHQSLPAIWETESALNCAGALRATAAPPAAPTACGSS